MLLQGQALTERQGAMLEADTIRYERNSCLLDADRQSRTCSIGGRCSSGEGIRYDTCRRRGTVNDALTNFTEGSTVWFLRGNVAQDSSSSRIYAGSSEITSCDLPMPHYHFSARELKWVSKNVLVARPVVLYVRDVPILWLPFIFQDVRPGRRSGILIPQFGLNDLVRPTRTYNRQITNIGYYWAPNDYFDVTGRLDWFANRYVQYGVQRPVPLAQPVHERDASAFNEQRQVGGGSGLTFRWDHRQQFSLSTSLNFNINYASNTAVIRGNAIDPLQNTQQITSSLNYSKRFTWGTLTLGGNRRQSLTDGSVQQLLPALTLSPVPIALGPDITWSPGLSLTNNTTRNPLADTVLRALPGRGFDTVALDASTRLSAFSFDTPVRFGGFNWQNSVQVSDQPDQGRAGGHFPSRRSHDSRPDRQHRRAANLSGDFQSSVDWDTGINLPVLFRGSWKLQPVVGVGNTHQRTVRHPEPEHERELRAPGQAVPLRGHRVADAVRLLSRHRPAEPDPPQLLAGDHLELPARRQRARGVRARDRPAGPADRPPERRAAAGHGLALADVRGQGAGPSGSDTTSADARKIRILSIATSGISYDFEQAKKPGFTGWTTQSFTNSLLSDLLPGFNLSLTHDLWRGHGRRGHRQVRPLPPERERQLRRLGQHLPIDRLDLRTGRKVVRQARPRAASRCRTSYVAESGRRPRPGSFFSSTQAPIRQRRARTFTANFNYQLTRTRPRNCRSAATPTARAWASAPISRPRRSGRCPGRRSTTSRTGSSSRRSCGSSASCTSGARDSTSCGTRTAISPSTSRSI